ncbi:MAG: hypothetical protein WCP20_10910 [Desulfuromonadales bacterium]
MIDVKQYIKNQVIALDIMVNAATGGSPYMTLSERAWAHQWRKTIAVLDWLFGADHCKYSTEGDESQYEVIK